jgi:hypothetical protein
MRLFAGMDSTATVKKRKQERAPKQDTIEDLLLRVSAMENALAAFTAKFKLRCEGRDKRLSDTNAASLHR